jgi:RING finger protein 113A
MSDNTSIPSTIVADETIPITDSSANIPFFKKSKPSKNKNIRKRKNSSAGEEDDSSAVITKERKLDTSNPFVQASRKGRRVAKEEISDIYAANKSAVTSVPEDIATRSAEWDTETDRDAQALLEKKLAAEEVIIQGLLLLSYIVGY